MSLSHLLLALSVVLIWGVNFLSVKLGLNEISPLLFCALRFLLVSIPAVFFIKPPKLPFKMTISYALFMFGIQFSFTFLGMNLGMTPGVGSLIMQVQVFFSMFFAAVYLKDRPGYGQVVGSLISFTGIAIVACHFDQNVSVAGFLCILCAAAAWGVGNLIAKQMPAEALIPVIAWGSFYICIPMFFLAALVEGTDSIVATYHQLSWQGFGALSYVAYISTWLGYGIWNWLLIRYPVGVIVPFTLLVPVVGMISSMFIFDEPFEQWKVVAAFFVIGGLCFSLISSRIQRLKISPEVA